MDKFKLAESIMPPTYFWILALVSIVINIIFPFFQAIPEPYNLFGLVLIFAGLVINLHTDSLFKKHETTVKPHKKPTKLVIEGFFKYSRHPMYLGMILSLIGLSIFLGSLISFVFPLIFFAIIQWIYIPVEEENLEREFRDYKHYKKKVRKWI